MENAEQNEGDGNYILNLNSVLNVTDKMFNTTG